MINNALTYISLFSSAGVGCYGFKQGGFNLHYLENSIDFKMAAENQGDYFI
ncbi:TPA: DNA cytosine methyltransferase [Streptococcus agalactiae]|uniref:DNA (cytosine-5-)-methyltransferase n=3 Tax=Peptoniphilaceae TaxID=1570339 RepID=A0A8H2M683_9FIRM|nr:MULTISPECIES: DNA cytosine methyltransferase [Peptoniphilaceae]HEO0300076.1 DNA cytosine methyltransferase [Streptococcus agalactiae]HEQ1240660.1 DNA cytosine methyltransferase [Streptococcus pyogenes]MBS4890224.1 DNA cytosine methyltransferase [Anaerococcus vaginalis]MDU7141873.1 DNA cytosine methyltransferase [Anaerococcus vaginalis]VFB15907.1 Uncharacterised protein [Urinicoccus massiliensis]